MKRERIGLIDLVPVVARYHMVFVCIALSNPGNKCLPDARLAPWLELMAGLVPAVEPPMTYTFSASGAHTAKFVPAVPSTVIG